jgi:Na+/phosphate symporter
MDKEPEYLPADRDPSLTSRALKIGGAVYPDEPFTEVDLKNRGRAWWRRVSYSKIGLFIVSLYFFVLAISMMREGARGLSPLLQEIFSLTSLANNLGFGWIFSYLIMSGSPVAASALTFFDAGAIDKLGTYGMIMGSRIGASFIVLFIGFIYVLRGRDRTTSLAMGLLSLLVTSTTYLPAFFIGLFVLWSGWFSGWQLHSGALLEAAIGSIITPVVSLTTGFFPQWTVFLFGLGIILISFNLFDKCLPQLSLKESQFGQMSRLVYHPLVMFALGALITMISMSVSLSLSILVPLSNRGFIRRENVIPYIMGANVTTFVDTLLAAALLGNPASFTIVLVGMISISIVSIAVLGFLHKPYRHLLLSFVDWITASNRNMALFMITIFVLPLILLLM